MIRNKSNIFSVDRGINRKKNGKLLQIALRALIQFSVVFWLIHRSAEKYKILFYRFTPHSCLTLQNVNTHCLLWRKSDIRKGNEFRRRKLSLTIYIVINYLRQMPCFADSDVVPIGVVLSNLSCV